MSMPFRIQAALPGCGGGAVSNIRIEPDTAVYDIAVCEGLINEGDKLFPEDEAQLGEMFYRPRSMNHLSLMVDMFNGFFEGVLKPLGIRFYRILSRIRGKSSPYDQKTGFVAMQRRVK